MKYALLLYEDDEGRIAKSNEEVATCVAYAAAMEKAGILVGGERLRPAESGAIVRISDDRTQVLDGPYTETKEQLGGFHIIDVPDLDEALRWAARAPTARRGVVEVRPLWPT
jgi:hypothetical protein